MMKSTKILPKEEPLTSTRQKGQRNQCKLLSSISRICFLRAVFVLALVAAAVTCGWVAYFVIHGIEHSAAVDAFDSVAATAMQRAKQMTLLKIEGASLMAELFGNAFRDADQWPYVAMSDFPSTAFRIGLMARPTDGPLTTGQGFAFNPLVKPDQVAAFEAFANRTYSHQQHGYTQKAGNQGVWAQHRSNRTNYPSSGDSETYENRYKILAPIFQMALNLTSVLLFDLHSTENVGPWIENCMDCSRKLATIPQASPVDAMHSSAYGLKACFFTTRLHSTLISGEPTFNLGVPIVLYSQDRSHSEAAGLITTTFEWTQALRDTVPSYFGDIMAVISPESDGKIDDIGETYTYAISGENARLLGKGDLHHDSFDHYAHTLLLNEIETAAPGSVAYRITVYPTQQTFQTSHVPLAVCLGFVGIILCCAIIFFSYDRLVKDEARRRKAILALKRRFVRFVSHEIRTPLNCAYMGLELLKTDFEEALNTSPAAATQDKMLDWLNIMSDVIDNCHNSVCVLNDILSYDKIEAGTLQMEHKPTDIIAVLRTTVGEFQIQAKNKDVSLELTVSCDGSEDFHCVMGDGTRLASVFRNLVSNALKFTPAQGSVKVSADVLAIPFHRDDSIDSSSTRRCKKLRPPPGGTIAICVRDEGVGMSKSQLELLFGEGVQFDADKLQHGGGSGLGLFISRNIVLQHGGTIKAESDGIGTGSKFTVQLPIHQRTAVAWAPQTCDNLDIKNEDVGASTTTHATADLTNHNATTQSLHRRVLIVEDVLSNQKMLRRLLERAGHVCDVAMNGQQAIDIVQADMQNSDVEHQPFDSILMDYEMPILNGPDATKRLRELGFQGAIFGVTGNVLAEDVEVFMNHGADAVVAKPIQFAKIEECWEKYEPINSQRSS